MSASHLFLENAVDLLERVGFKIPYKNLKKSFSDLCKPVLLNQDGVCLRDTNMIYLDFSFVLRLST